MCLYIGEGGVSGDGDITKPANLVAFREYVMEHTGHMGVHFVMGDGVSKLSIVLVYLLFILAGNIGGGRREYSRIAH